MPIFEYSCPSCGTRFEKLVRRSSSTAIACPDCGGHELEPQLSTFAAQVSTGSQPAPQSGGCASGMCGMPGYCNRN